MYCSIVSNKKEHVDEVDISGTVNKMYIYLSFVSQMQRLSKTKEISGCKLVFFS